MKVAIMFKKINNKEYKILLFILITLIFNSLSITALCQVNDSQRVNCLYQKYWPWRKDTIGCLGLRGYYIGELNELKGLKKDSLVFILGMPNDTFSNNIFVYWMANDYSNYCIDKTLTLKEIKKIIAEESSGMSIGMVIEKGIVKDIEYYNH